MPATNYAKNQQLNHEIRGEAYAGLSSSWYIGFSLSTIEEDGSGILEPVDIGYRRVPVPRTTAFWVEATSGSLTNSSPIVFPQSTQHWGTIKEIFIANNPTLSGSYIWFHKQLDTPMAILDGTKITIPAYAIAIDRQE